MLASCNDPNDEHLHRRLLQRLVRIGGWAFVVLEGDRQVRAASGKASGKSNNSFELLAVFSAMSWISAELPIQAVTLWSESVSVHRRVPTLEGHLAQQWLEENWRELAPSTPTNTRRLTLAVARCAPGAAASGDCGMVRRPHRRCE